MTCTPHLISTQLYTRHIGSIKLNIDIDLISDHNHNHCQLLEIAWTNTHSNEMVFGGDVWDFEHLAPIQSVQVAW